ncbi:MAG: hypothetical protein R6V47_05005 [Candidatus Delongbacteria bacterium]
MLLNSKYIYILVILFASVLFASVTFKKNDIENIAARDIYDILSRIYTLRGYSHGLTGQPVYFSRAGKSSGLIDLYIDDIHYGMPVSDISFINIDHIEKITIDETSAAIGGISVYVYTKDPDNEIPVSKIIYRDGFLNFRDLSAIISQKICPDASFRLTGEILDHKDNRETSDNFKYPYSKQNYSLNVTMPEIYTLTPHLDISYFAEKKWALDSDSLFYRPERSRIALHLNKSSPNFFNRFVAVNINESGTDQTGIINIYNELEIKDSLSVIRGRIGFSSEDNSNSSGYSSLAYRLKTKHELNARAYLLASDTQKKIFTLHGGVSLDCKIFELRTSNGYIYNKGPYTRSFFENYVTAERTFNKKLKLLAGYDNITENKRIFYRSGIVLIPVKNTVLQSNYLLSGSKNKKSCLKNKVVTSISWSDRYFENDLELNISVNHIYSEYFIEDQKETVNNLNFNLRARIADLELFFGSDNFLKEFYGFNNRYYRLNDHYKYSTVENFEMPGRDEIWGVRWSFYR